MLWQRAGIAKTISHLFRPIVALFIAPSIGYTILVWKYCCPLRSCFDIAIAILLGLAIATASGSATASGRSRPSVDDEQRQLEKESVGRGPELPDSHR